MEEAVTVDLLPVLEALDHVNGNLAQLSANTDMIFLAVAGLIGVVVGCAVGWLLHDLWRA